MPPDIPLLRLSRLGGRSGSAYPTPAAPNVKVATAAANHAINEPTDRYVVMAALGGAKSWIMAIAENLGVVADKLAKEMTDLSEQIGKGDDQAKASTNVKFAAKSQEFSMFFNSAQTVIKTLGEALASGSRKQ